MDKKASLAWIDLEMTGLDPEKCRIIEVGVILTDWDFNEHVRYEAIVKQPQSVLDQADDWVKQNMKELISKVPDGQDETEVKNQIISLINEHCGSDVYLAGNSVYHDRRFIRAFWPEVDKRLHYRVLDVSAWKVVMSNKFNIVFDKPEKHRALEDIQGSISELKGYLKHFSKASE